MRPTITRRLLVVSSDPARADVVRRVSAALATRLASEADGEGLPATAATLLETDVATTGLEAENLVEIAVAVGHRYAIVLLDADLVAPGDGVPVLSRLWQHDAALEIVLLVRPDDQAWAPALDAIGGGDQVLILGLPLGRTVLRHFLGSLTEKWVLRQAAQATMNDLEARVQERTAALEAAHRQLVEEMRRRELAEVELRHAQKLEAMGRLAAGIAHEINTPMQYLSDNLHFLADGMQQVLRLVHRYREALNDATAAPVAPAVIEALLAEETACDLGFVFAESPGAARAAFEAVGRVTEIVRSMKELAHPGGRDPVPADLHHLLHATIAVARTETKRVAVVERDFSPVPPVRCYPGDLGQVFLNLLVNAAHAVAEQPGAGGLGRIVVRTATEGEHVLVHIDDSGPGVPPAIRSQIFEPFFTTKPVGQGSGQGLALVRAIVVDRHGGRVSVGIAPEGGARFTVALPIAGPPASMSPPTAGDAGMLAHDPAGTP